MDALSTALDRRPSRPGGRFRDPVDPPRRRVVDPRRHQFHHDDLQHARAGHDLLQDAAIRLVDPGDDDSAVVGVAGAGGRDHHGAHRSQFRNHVFQSGRRRRPAPVPTPVLVLRSSRSLHHDPAGLRHHQPGRRDFQPQAGVRLSRHGLCAAGDHVHRHGRLGPPYVHGWFVVARPGLLRPLEHGDRGADRHQSFLLDRHHVGRLG